MTWSALSAEVACMFHEYTWRTDDLERAYEVCLAAMDARAEEYRADPWNRRIAGQRARKWRSENRDRDAQNVRRWQKENPDKMRDIQRRYRKRKLEKDPEAVRAQLRARQARYVAKKRAEAGLPPPSKRCGCCGETGHNARSCVKKAA